MTMDRFGCGGKKREEERKMRLGWVVRICIEE